MLLLFLTAAAVAQKLRRRRFPCHRLCHVADDGSLSSHYASRCLNNFNLLTTPDGEDLQIDSSGRQQGTRALRFKCIVGVCGKTVDNLGLQSACGSSREMIDMVPRCFRARPLSAKR